jgi:hypothetical protein
MGLNTNADPVAPLQALSSGDFGARFGIQADVGVFYESARDLLARALDVDTSLLDPRAGPPWARTSTRAALDEALEAIVTQPDHARSIIQRAEVDLAALPEGSPSSDQVQTPPILLRGWNETAVARAVGQRLYGQLSRDGVAVHAQVLEPDSSHQEAFEAALAVLAEVVPVLAAEVLPHVTGVALVRSSPRVFDGAHFNAVPQVVTLDEAILADTVFAAESLLHECLHQKLADLGLIRSIMSTPVEGEARSVRIPWGTSAPRWWEPSRALAALHVYVHLGAFYWAVANDLGRALGPVDVMRERMLRSVRRAAYLGLRMTDADNASRLGRHGHLLCAWLGNINRDVIGLACLEPKELNDCA